MEPGNPSNQGTNIQLGAAINVDAIQAIQIVWGTAVSVFNFFSKSNMQVSAMMYAGNCSIVGGDSKGWKSSVQALIPRCTVGFNIGTVRIGYPGSSGILEGLLKTQCGSRWLGVLAVAVQGSTQDDGARELYKMLKATANTTTSQYFLDEDQTEKMWVFGRELFLGTPIQEEFQAILSNCQNSSKMYLASAAYPAPATEFLTPVMRVCFQAWEMANRPDGENSYSPTKIQLAGSTGFGHVIFYLVAVCGFKVTAHFDKGEVDFGDQNSPTKIVVNFERQLGIDWKVRYLVDNLSIEESIQEWLGGERDANMIRWKPGASGFAPVHPGRHICSGRYTNPTESMNLAGYLSLKAKLERAGVTSYVSAWLKNYLHAILRNTQLLAVGNPPTLNTTGRTPSRTSALLGRLRLALTTFDPGLIEPNHLDELLSKIEKDEPQTRLGPLQNILPREASKVICDCEAHATLGGISCRFMHITMQLEEFAWKVWICAHVDVSSHILLREMGPVGEWNVMNQLGMMSGAHSMIPSTISTTKLFSCIAARLAGKITKVDDHYLLGLVAGGAVIGLRSNETQPLLTDPGFCLYIVPGAMESPTRRLTEMCQSRLSGEGFGRWGNALDLAEVQQPRDMFGGCELFHLVEVKGDKAALQTSIKVSGKTIGVDVIRAINHASTIRVWSGCLGECARGRLTEEETSRAQVVDPQNYGKLVQLAGDGQRDLYKLKIVLACNNTLVERAVLSHQIGEDACMVQLGSCTHCAVRAALIQGVPVLFD